MSASWIIDGYNVILRLGSAGRLPEGELAQRRQILEDRVAHFGRLRGIRPLVVYDGRRLSGGHAGAGHGDHLEVTFVAPPAEADDLIHHRAAGWRREGQEVRVVTSDQELASRVRNEGAVVISTEAFGLRLVELGREKSDGHGQAAGMADIEAHFLALHQAEERREAASRPVAPPPPASPRPVAVKPSSPSEARRRGKEPAPDLGLEAAASREKRRQKGRLRQQRRLQSRRKGKAGGRRRPR